jgi:hypothetical protein
MCHEDQCGICANRLGLCTAAGREAKIPEQAEKLLQQAQSKAFEDKGPRFSASVSADQFLASRFISIIAPHRQRCNAGRDVARASDQCGKVRLPKVGFVSSGRRRRGQIVVRWTEAISQARSSARQSSCSRPSPCGIVELLAVWLIEG